MGGGVHEKLTDILLQICFGLSCFYHKFQDEIITKTFPCGNTGSDVKVPLPDVKVLLPGCVKSCLEMLREE